MTKTNMAVQHIGHSVKMRLMVGHIKLEASSNKKNEDAIDTLAVIIESRSEQIEILY